MTAATLKHKASDAVWKAGLLDSNLYKHAKGRLIFPDVWKAGFAFGGEYGQGVLWEGYPVNTQDAWYYNMVSVSWGFQLGIQRRSVMFFFMTDEALADFKNSGGWKVGVDASVAILTADIGAEVNTSELVSDVIAIVTDRDGLMYNLSLEGTKITRIHKR